MIIEMSLQQEVDAILDNSQLDSPDYDESKSQLLYTLISKYRWDDLCSILLKDLQDLSKKRHWDTIVEVLYYATNDHRPMPSNDVIALLFVCSAEEDGISDGNLVWTITHQLKKVAYTADYDPVQDPLIWPLIQKYTQIIKETKK